jgi:SAM-dependent methyltransferase
MHNTLQSSWLDSPLGKYFLRAEKAIYDEQVSNLFGFNAMQMGMLTHDLLEYSRIPQKLHVDSLQGDVCLDSAYLPFTEGCMDLVCMPHTLEYSENPHQTLREVERVLVPDGYVILTGINPFSPWGVRRRLSKQKHYPWCGNRLTLNRIKDWLALLGLETVKSGATGFALPINDEKWLARLQPLETFGQRWFPIMGGIYYVVAKKRVVNLTLLKPKWKTGLVASGLVSKPQQKKPIKQKNVQGTHEPANENTNLY